MGLFGASEKKAPDLPIAERRSSKPARNGTAPTTVTSPSKKGHPSKSPTHSSSNTRSKSSKKPERPPLERRGTTTHTRYVEMLLSLDRIPRLHNIYASFFTWVLLAGYIVFPATFTSLRDNENLQDQEDSAGGIEKKVLHTVRNAPLLYVAAVCCGVGCLGCIGLWWRWRKNYVWVINRIFLPAFMNSIAGLISTLVNIYSAQDGQYSVTAKITIVVTAASCVVTAGLFLAYNNLALERVKKKHERETREGSYTAGPGGVGGVVARGARVNGLGGAAGRGSGSLDGAEEKEKETFVDKVKRKAHEPALEPTSVV